MIYLLTEIATVSTQTLQIELLPFVILSDHDVTEAHQNFEIHFIAF